MSLRMAVLALLTARPMTGFDLMKQFDSSVGFLWSAPHTQIYPELRKLEQAGLVMGEEVARGQRGTKRLYSITRAGVDELQRMVSTVEEPRVERDYSRLKASFFEWAEPAAARSQLQAHRNHYTAAGKLYQRLRDEILDRSYPLLQERLKNVPEEQHDAVVEFKAYAYAGLIERARVEVEWADEGLRLLEELDRRPSDSRELAEAVAGSKGRRSS